MTLVTTDLAKLFDGLDPALAAYVEAARIAVSDKVVRDGKVDRAACRRRATRAAWPGLDRCLGRSDASVDGVGRRLAEEGRLGATEGLVLRDRPR